MRARRCCGRGMLPGSRPASPTAISSSTNPRARRSISKSARAHPPSALTTPTPILRGKRTSTASTSPKNPANPIPPEAAARRFAMTYQNFKFDADADGIATVTWDMPDRSMNLINLTVIEELAAIVEKVAGDAAIKGAVITGGKDTFCAGADLTMLDRFGQVFAEMARTQGEEAAARMMFEESRKLSLLYRRLETCGKPWVAAINGTAVGGGFELCLACHRRIAADNPKTRIGLPEIKIGLFPGAGGTQRIARMLAPVDALQMLLKGDQLRLERAKALKLVDAVVAPEELI